MDACNISHGRKQACPEILAKGREFRTAELRRAAGVGGQYVSGSWKRQAGISRWTEGADGSLLAGVSLSFVHGKHGRWVCESGGAYHVAIPSRPVGVRRSIFVDIEPHGQSPFERRRVGRMGSFSSAVGSIQRTA